MIRRINLIGGPGSGKTSLAAWLFAEMKRDRRPAEFVPEFVKEWAYEGRTPQGFDQYLITSTQMWREDIVLRSIPEAIAINECPVILGACYGRKYGTPEWWILAQMAMAFERKYESLNVLIDRRDLKYKHEGRFQTVEQALEMDAIIGRVLEENRIKVHKIGYDEGHALKDLVYERISAKTP